MNRRAFLGLGLQLAAGIIVNQAVSCWADTGMRRLSFYHTHTKKHLDITYGYGGRYDRAALDRLNRYLSDFRTGEVHPIDPGVLDILCQIQQKMGCHGTYEVISAYRSPATNQYLRKRSNGVAKHSLHMEGRAIDIRLTGQNTHHVRNCAISLQRGGVGYYAKHDFVHIDTGRVRTW